MFVSNINSLKLIGETLGYGSGALTLSLRCQVFRAKWWRFFAGVHGRPSPNDGKLLSSCRQDENATMEVFSLFSYESRRLHLRGRDSSDNFDFSLQLRLPQKLVPVCLLKYRAKPAVVLQMATAMISLFSGLETDKRNEDGKREGS